MAEYPERVDRFTVDRAYTDAVGRLMRDATGVIVKRPSEVRDVAQAALVTTFEASYPGASVPEYIKTLGLEPTDLE